MNKLKQYSRLDITKEILKGVPLRHKFILYGISGMGKTYILEMIGKKARSLFNMLPIYINLEKVNSEELLVKHFIMEVKKKIVKLGYKLENSYAWKILEKCKARGLIDCISSIRDQLYSDYDLKLLILLDNLHSLETSLDIVRLSNVFDVASSMKVPYTREMCGSRVRIQELTILPLKAIEIRELFRVSGFNIPLYLAQEIEASFTGVPLYLNIILPPIKTALKMDKPVDLSFIEMLYRDPLYQDLLVRVATASLWRYIGIYGEKFLQFLRIVKEGSLQEIKGSFLEFEKIGFLYEKDGFPTFVDKYLLRAYENFRYPKCL